MLWCKLKAKSEHLDVTGWKIAKEYSRAERHIVYFSAINVVHKNARVCDLEGSSVQKKKERVQKV